MKRRRHTPTVSLETFNVFPMAMSLDPSADISTISARLTGACGSERDLVIDSNCSRSDGDTVISCFGRPRGMARLLSFQAASLCHFD